MFKKILFILFIIFIIFIIPVAARTLIEIYDYNGYALRYKINYSWIDAINMTTNQLVAQNLTVVNLANITILYTNGTLVTPNKYLKNGTDASFKDVNLTKLNVTGNLQLGVDPLGYASYFQDAGDIYTGGHIVAIGGNVMSFAPPYGFTFLANENSARLEIISVSQTANLTAATQVICDTGGTFSEDDVNKFMTVISSTPDYADATGEFSAYVNSSCMVVSFASSGSDTIGDAVDMNYIVYPHPIFAVLDNGFITIEIGENLDAKFEIHIPNQTGFYGVFIESEAGADQAQTLTIDTRNYGGNLNFTGVVGLNLYMNLQGSNKDLVGYVGEVEISDLYDSDYSQMEFHIIGANGGKGNTIRWVELFGEYDELIRHGEEHPLELAWLYNSSASVAYNVTFNLTSTAKNIPLFVENNDYLCIGDDHNITEMGIDLSTFSSHNLDFEYWYSCNIDGTDYCSLSVTDTTNGLKTTGSIRWEIPDDWNMTRIDINGNDFPNLDPRLYMCLERTRGFVLNPPIENTMSVTSGDLHFIMAEDFYKTRCVDSPPVTCSADYFGTWYCNSVSVALLWCDGTSWQEYAETADITIHNNLGGLQGCEGGGTECYHLGSAEKTNQGAYLMNETDVILNVIGHWVLGNFTEAFNNIYNISDSSLLYNNTDVYFSKVGIGTDSLEGKLTLFDYQGGTGTSDIVSLAKHLVISGAFNLDTVTQNAVGLLISDFDNDAGANYYPIYVEDENNFVNFFLKSGESSGEGGLAYFGSDVYIGGTVGIGITTPESKFHINSTSDNQLIIESDDDASIWLRSDTDNFGEDDNPFIKFSQDGIAVQSIIGHVGATGIDPEGNAYIGTLDNALLIGTLDAIGTLQFGADNVVRMTIIASGANAGNIGIRTTTPESPLSVIGNANISTDLNVGDDLRVRDDVIIDGDLGIGTDSPGEKLDVNGNILVSTPDPNLFIKDNNQANPAFVDAEITIQSSGDDVFTMDTIGGDTDHYRFGTLANVGLAIWTNNFEQMRIDIDGNVGIGTIAPLQKLVVVGNVNITSNLLIGGQGNIQNITMYTSPSGNPACCGPDDSYNFVCSAGRCP